MHKPSAINVKAYAVEHVFRLMPTVLLGNLIVGGLFVTALWFSTPDPVRLLYWWLAIFFQPAAIWSLAHPTLGVRKPSPQTLGWLLAASSLYQGLLWGSSAFLFLDPGSMTNQVGIIFVIMAMSIGSLPMSSYWLPSFFAFTVSATGLLAIRMFQIGGIEHIAMGLGLVLHILLVGSYVVGVRRNLYENISLRFENLELIDELLQADQEKSRFLAAASHDLRQPVHAMALMLEALENELSSARGRVLSAHIATALESHNRLLNALLDISRLDAGVVEPRLQHFALQPLLESLLREVEPMAREKSIDIHLRAQRIQRHCPCQRYSAQSSWQCAQIHR